MSDDQKLDARLRAFLEREESNVERGHTLENVHGELADLRQQYTSLYTDHHALRRVVHRHDREIIVMRNRLDFDDAEELTTGPIDVADVKRELDARDKDAAKAALAKEQENQLWWKRTAVQWIVGGVAWVLTTVVATLITLAIAHAETPPSGKSAPATHQERNQP